MDFLSADFWNERYAQDETGWDLGTVSPPLKAYIDGLTDTSIRILVPGAGNGYEAEYLYRKGFANVFIVDFAQQALTDFSWRNPEFPTDQLICADFFQYAGTFDLILEQTFFCALNPDLRPDYVKHMHTLLVPGGLLVGVLFDRRFEGGPPFGGSREEYLSLFTTTFTEVRMEPCYNSIAPRQGTELFIRCQK